MTFVGQTGHFSYFGTRNKMDSLEKETNQDKQILLDVVCLEINIQNKFIYENLNRI